MSSDVAIRARGLSKCYLIYNKSEDRLKQMLFRWKRYYREFWALRNVDLEIYRGETVGILGRNGSGKTTMLELITGTLTPSAGAVEVNGRIAALLGLGAGFNPEFTGRENVVLNATLLGLSSQQIDRVFERIAAFADIGDFMERPVKTYSSGMYARLAFSVAIHVEPDILIVDETLAVGDEAFQRKCFGRINDLKAGGSTILFVTHSAATVVELCDRAVLLDHGERLLTGSPRVVVAQYQRLVHAMPDQAEGIRATIRALDAGGPAAAAAMPAAAPSAAPPPPSGEARGRQEEAEDEAFLDPGLVSKSTQEFAPQGALIHDIRIETPGGRRVNCLIHRHDYDFVYRVRFTGDHRAVRFGMQIRTIKGIELNGQVTHPDGEGIAVADGQEFTLRFPFRADLIPGTYFLNAGVAGYDEIEGVTFLHRLVDVGMFRIMPLPRMNVGGLVDLRAGREARILPAAVAMPVSD